MTTLVIPAAGRATRLRPITSNCSKAMVPVNGRPAIAYILDRCSWADEVIVVDGELDDIRNFVSRYDNVSCVKQNSLAGPLDAFKVGLENSRHEGPVVCWMCDTIVPGLQPRLDDVVYVHEVNDPRPYCMTDGRQYWEKPEECPSNLALIGVYSFGDRQRLKHALGQTTNEPEMSALLAAYSSYMEPIVADQWLDVGNIDNYYQARAKLLNRTSRDFNSIYVDTFLGTITKSSENFTHKIELEKNWYLELDDWQALFAPRVLPSPMGTLVMTLESGVPLSDLLVYDDVPLATWRSILDRLFKIMHEVIYRPISPRPTSLREMYVDRARQRLETFAPDLVEWAVDVGERACRSPRYSQVIHGDMQLGNIIYDAYTGKIKLVDPRGSFSEPGTSGDQQYDIAKMFMDVYWGFNSTLAGISCKNDSVATYLGLKAQEYGYDWKLMKELGLQLLVTTVPFHDDNPAAQRYWIEQAREFVSQQVQSCPKTSFLN